MPGDTAGLQCIMTYRKFYTIGEGAEALADVDFRAESVVPFEGAAVRVGDRHIARLHLHEGLMGVEVVIRSQ